MLCPNCGKCCDDAMSVCPSCGTRLRSARKSSVQHGGATQPQSNKGRSFSAPSDNRHSSFDVEHEQRRARTAGTNHIPRQAVASATGSSAKAKSKPKLSLVADNVENEKPNTEKKESPRELSTPIKRRYIDRTPEPSTNAEAERKKQNAQPTVTNPASELPYPIVYLPAKSADGSDVQIPYLNTPHGLVPWIATSAPQIPAQQNVVRNNRPTIDGNASPIDIDSLDDSNEDDSAENNNAFDDTNDSYEDEELPFEEEQEYDGNNATVQEDSDDPFDYTGDEEVNETYESDQYEPEPESEPEPHRQAAFKKRQESNHRPLTKEEQMDEEDDEAFQQAMKVTVKGSSDHKESKKKSPAFRSAISSKGSGQTKEKDATSKADSEKEQQTVFDGFDPNADHYYDDVKPAFTAERDHITKDFVIRVVGAIVIVIGLTVAMIYMV